jgi:hypothetical protein
VSGRKVEVVMQTETTRSLLLGTTALCANRIWGAKLHGVVGKEAKHRRERFEEMLSRLDVDPLKHVVQEPHRHVPSFPS